MNRLLSATRMVAACVALAAQAGVVGATLLDAQKGVSAASHYEGGGTDLHFAHSEADCVMCRAQHLGDASPFNPEPARQLVAAAPNIFVAVLALRASSTSSQHSRAPPIT